MDDVQKFTELKKEISTLSNQKIRLEERLKTEKTRLETVMAEITAKGYDPQKLSVIRKEKEIELKKLLEDLEIKTKEATEKLNIIEA